MKMHTVPDKKRVVLANSVAARSVLYPEGVSSNYTVLWDHNYLMGLKLASPVLHFQQWPLVDGWEHSKYSKDISSLFDLITNLNISWVSGWIEINLFDDDIASQILSIPSQNLIIHCAKNMGGYFSSAYCWTALPQALSSRVWVKVTAFHSWLLVFSTLQISKICMGKSNRCNC